MVWVCELHYREKNHSNMLCYTEVSYTLVFFNSGYLLSGTCRQKLSV